MRYCIEQYKARFNFEVKKDIHKAKLLKKCREAKQQLSNSFDTVIDEDSFCDDEDYSLALTRAQFENLCEPIFQKFIPLLTSVIEDSRLTKD